MNMSVIDAHIHIDDYAEKDRLNIVHNLSEYNVDALIAVSKNVHSATQIYELAKRYDAIKPAFGYHPEQILPSEEELDVLFDFMEKNQKEMVAVGEVGLPFYKRQEDNTIQLEPYIEVLEQFIIFAKRLQKPIVLHAIYDGAPIVLDLLEKHSIKQAHFHWFKGDIRTIERLISNKYHISVTPDLCYKERTQQLVKQYPLHLIMAETDGPWPFSGSFKCQLTHPKMIHQTIKKIARIKEVTNRYVYDVLYKTTKEFFDI